MKGVPTVADDKKSEELLSQILDVQRQQLEEYRRVTSQSLELQRQGVETLEMKRAGCSALSPAEARDRVGDG